MNFILSLNLVRKDAAVHHFLFFKIVITEISIKNELKMKRGGCTFLVCFAFVGHVCQLSGQVWLESCHARSVVCFGTQKKRKDAFLIPEIGLGTVLIL
jgi:hypothetical protein